MLDVVLYRRDRRGRLLIKEGRFDSLEDLAWYLVSPEGRRWEWAEVTPLVPPGAGRVARTIAHPAELLRRMVERSRAEDEPGLGPG